MGNKYSGTQTEKNLMAAFAGESEARNKYTYFASKAKKEGFEQISALFLKTADNEKEHSLRCMRRTIKAYWRQGTVLCLLFCSVTGTYFRFQVAFFENAW